MTGQTINSLEEALALPKGELFVLVGPYEGRSVFGPGGWIKASFNEEDVRWAYSRYAKDKQPQAFGTQSELLLDVIRKHPFRARMRGWYDGLAEPNEGGYVRSIEEYSTVAPKPPVPPKGPSGIGSPRKEVRCGGGTCTCS